MVASLPHPVLHTDSIYPDTTNAIAGLFAPDHSKLKALAVSKNKKQNTSKGKNFDPLFVTSILINQAFQSINKRDD